MWAYETMASPVKLDVFVEMIGVCGNDYIQMTWLFTAWIGKSYRECPAYDLSLFHSHEK